MSTGASFARGQSKQDYGTPREFLAAVEKRFGKLSCDLAATERSKVASMWLGEGSPMCSESLAVGWRSIGGLLWLNPPFGNIKPWAKKCSEESLKGAEILMLVPASIGSNWFWDYVYPAATTFILSPRLTFNIGFDANGNELFDLNPKTGKPDPYPKDCMLCYFGGCQKISRWVWK